MIGLDARSWPTSWVQQDAHHQHIYGWPDVDTACPKLKRSSCWRPVWQDNNWEVQASATATGIKVAGSSIQQLRYRTSQGLVDEHKDCCCSRHPPEFFSCNGLCAQCRSYWRLLRVAGRASDFPRASGNSLDFPIFPRASPEVPRRLPRTSLWILRGSPDFPKSNLTSPNVNPALWEAWHSLMTHKEFLWINSPDLFVFNGEGNHTTRNLSMNLFSAWRHQELLRAWKAWKACIALHSVGICARMQQEGRTTRKEKALR